ncbi:hypothetical protein [Micromonospora sp. NPDC047730]|uniref:hypothetical protein n=1 Tax=Micromonospora sp. NPDC047730 TaxID=3364253 RepID=UPI00371E2B1C
MYIDAQKQSLSLEFLNCHGQPLKPPPENFGAETQSRYMWQAALATIDGLKALSRVLAEHGNLAEPSDDKIICEFFGDWVLLRHGQAEIVSCIHWEPSHRPIAGVRLLGSHGLAELFRSWRAANETASCRLITNATIARRPQGAMSEPRQQQLSGQQLNQQEAAAAIAAGIVDDLNERHAYNTYTASQANSAEELRAQIARFLSVLTIESGVPSREYIGNVGSRQHVAPILQRLGLGMDAADMVWSALNVQLLGAMSGSRSVTPRDLLQTIERIASKTSRHPPSTQADHPDEQVIAYLTVFAASMSSAPGIWAALAEETIRTAIVTGLNAANLGRATAETLNGRGKTDILVQLGDDTKLIIELKYWSGRKDFAQALQQLLSYTTWRDTNIVIMPLITIQGVTTAIQEAATEVQKLSNRASPAPRFNSERMDFELHALGDPFQRINLRLVPVPLVTSAKPGPGRPVKRRMK